MTPNRNHSFSPRDEPADREAAECAAARAVAAARARLVLGRDAKSAFFATLALRLRPEPSWDIDTVATDGKLLLYHPPFVTGLTPDELTGVVAHEVMHCALAHPVRRGGRTAVWWNIACDLAINLLLLDVGMVLPAGRLVPGEGRFAGLPPGKCAEEYYAALADADGCADDSGDPSSSGGDPGGCGEVIDAAAADPATAVAVESEWKVAVVQARQAAAGRGALPAGLVRAAEEVVHPPADWRSVLREFVATHARNDYSWVRPNRRFIAQGFYLPGLHSEELGDVVLAVDTSGSIDEKTLGLFAAETNAVLATYDCAVTVLYHDTTVQKVQVWQSADGPLVLDPVGGGGTSHVCVFDWIDRAGLEPPCVICLTDLETEFPIFEPTAPVLWAVVGGCTTAPPFGRTIRLIS